MKERADRRWEAGVVVWLRAMWPAGRRRVVLACVGASGLLTGCGSLGVESGAGAAQVRFVEVAPGVGPVDFSVNGVAAAYGVDFESFTSYLPVSPGLARVAANRVGTGQALVSGQGMLTGGHQYTTVLSRGSGGTQERVFEDQTSPAPAGRTALRILNAYAGVSAITVYVTPLGRPGAAPEAVLSVGAETASPYINLVSGDGWTVTAAIAEGNLSLPVASVVLKAGAGAVRTVVFAGTGQVGGGSVVAFTLADVESQ